MNDWWQQHAPLAVGLYGPALLSNGAVNHEMLGAGLGELPFTLVYSREDESFWYNDYAVGGFCRTTRERVEILFKIIVGKAAAEEPASTRNVIFMLRDHSRKVVDAARAILEVDPGYWERNKRVIAGKVEVFSSRESCKRFAEEAITEAEGQSLALREAFGVYTRYCDLHSAQPLSRIEFQKEINQEFDQKYGVRLRNDLPSGGKVTRGWTRIGLRKEFLSMSDCP
jgi:hypothetical protein